ncbi:hypothetical protein ACFWJ4_21750 [Kitasatospora sp. NPDC127067]|uniref:hypothetical protein n=1 Tax=Kitasatospora sp. NPDC127067 TaxID=3347126 RepID=UPI003667F663
MASETPNGPDAMRSDPRLDPLACRNYNIQISYTGEPIGQKDWYGLYSKAPDPRDWKDGLVPHQWQWAETSSTYQSEAQHGTYAAAYWTWNESTQRYDLVAAKPLIGIDCRSY